MQGWRLLVLGALLACCAFGGLAGCYSMGAAAGATERVFKQGMEDWEEGYHDARSQ